MTTMKNHLISSQPWKRLLLPAVVAGSLLALPASMRATLPNTGSGNLTVIFGSATYPTLGNATTGALNITAGSNNTVLGWINFSDGTAPGGNLSAGDLINFILPSSTGAILNQVTGGVTTVVNGGTIASNGKIFILNPAGITLNTGAAVNAASFYASTIPETLAYFEANGNLQVFTSTPPATGTTGAIIVQGGVQLSTIGGNGTIGFAGASDTLGSAAATLVTGNLYLESQGGAITLSAGAGTTTVGSASAGGSLTVISNGGAVDLANGSATNIFQGATVSSVGPAANGNVTATNAFTASTASTSSTINAGTGATAGTVTLPNADFASIGINGQNVSITDPTANTIALGTSTIQGTLSVTSTGGSINNTGAVAATGAISLTANTAGKSITFSTSGNVSFGAVNSTGAGNSVTITGTGNLAFTTANVTSPTISITTTGGNFTDAGWGTAASTKATISASGNVNVAAENDAQLIVTAGNTITQSSAIVAAPKATFNAPTITLTNAANSLGGTSLVLTGGGGSSATPVQIADANGASLILGTGTNVTGATTITNGGGNIVLGTAAADTITFGGTLGLTATGAGTISTVSTNVNVGGAVTANTGGGNVGLGLAASTNTSFGQIGGAIGAGNLTINETSTTNLGAITSTGALTVTSGGNIVNTGAAVVNVAGGVTLSAGTVSAPATIQIGASGSSAVIPGTVTLTIASGLTLWDAPGNTAVTVSANANNVATEAIWITDNSNLTVNSAGAGGIGTLSFNLSGTGSVTVTDPTAIILTNLVDKTANAAAIGVTANAGSITLGSGIALAGSGTVTLTATGTGGSVTDTASSPVSIFGGLTVSSKSITLNNNTANSVGAVTLTSSGSAAYTEGGSVNIAGITLTGASGTLAVTSVNGSIIQTGAVTVPAGYTAASFSAPAGGVSLNLAGGNAINKSAVVSITAGGAGATGNSTIYDNQQLVLGNVTDTLGTFTASTLASGGSITQASGTSIFEYGALTVTTQGAVVTLANSGNNFGGITIDTTNGGGAAGGANIKIQEAGTDNYVSIKAGTAGSLTATDATANIIETGNTGIVAGGGASFTASAGSITLGATGNNFGGLPVLLVTTGNAAITDANGTLQLADQTNVGGNLTATETLANGIIKDGGSSSTITVTGNLAALAPTAGTGYDQFVGSNSTFGGVELQAGTGTSSLLDNGNLILNPSSRVGGPTTITSAGNITTAGTGGSNFANSLTLVASGSIVVTNAINVGAGLTVDAIAGPTNLSFLSKTANLNSIAVTNAGNTSNYTGPSP